MEIWKDVVGYEGLYQVSNYGNVKNTQRPIKLHFDKKGYVVVGLSKNNIPKLKKVHRLVAEAFIQNPDNLPFVNHKDECKSNNFIDNLEWCTSEYNNTYGSRVERAKKKVVKRVLQYTKDNKLIKEWESITSVSNTLNIHNGSISECCKGKRKTAGGFIWKYGEQNGSNR